MEQKEQRPLGAEIRRTGNAIKNYIDNVLLTKLNEKLTGVEGMTMVFIFRHQGQDLTARDIMARFDVSKATVSQILHGIEKKGLIAMRPLKDDKRVKIIVLTEKGQKVNEEFTALFAEMNSRIEKNLTEEEKRQLRSTLLKMRENIGDQCSSNNPKTSEKKA
jgi:DNA-binding MarR family transcriptional regulator